MFVSTLLLKTFLSKLLNVTDDVRNLKPDVHNYDNNLYRNVLSKGIKVKGATVDCRAGIVT